MRISMCMSLSLLAQSAGWALRWRFAIFCVVTAFAGLALAQPGPWSKPGVGGFGAMKPPVFLKGGDLPEVRAPVSYVDVHVHPVATGPGAGVISSLDDELSAMAQAGMRRLILMPPPQTGNQRAAWDYESFIEALRRQPAHFGFLGGGGSLNVMIHETPADRVDDALRQRFTERAERILADGAAGFGEIAVHHLSLTSGHPYESVPADHPLLLLLADIAAARDVVMDLHFDLVASDMTLPEPLRHEANPAQLRENLTSFERLLDHNARARIVWAHAGSDPLGHWTPAISRKLLSRHSNLYMSLRTSGPNSGMRNTLLAGGAIDPEWLAVLKEFPDRFVIGGDQFFVSGAARSGPAVMFSTRASGQRRLQAMVLSRLPPDLAGSIGYENAKRLYKLKD